MEKKQVVHPELGLGEIVQRRNCGFELLVEFTTGFQKWVRFDEIVVQQNSPTLPIQLVVPRKPILSKQSYLARRMIEAFRLGIVPYEQVDQFTFGRDSEVDSICEWLNSPNNNIAVVAGEYGAGKSHILSYSAAKAMNLGFAVAEVETDRLAVPFCKPKAIFRHVIRTFAYYDPIERKKKNFRDFLASTLQRGEAFDDHPYFKWFKYLDHDALWEWISCENDTGRPIPNEFDDWPRQIDYRDLPKLPADTKSANVYCYLLSSLGWAAKNVMGLSGLLVNFDEAESVDTLGNKSRWERAINFINAMVRTANNDKILLGLNNYHNELTFSRYMYKIPFLYQPRSELKIMFAFTPSGGIPSIIKQFPNRWINLKSLNYAALSQVFDEIYNHYMVSYPGFTIDKQLFTKINSVNNSSINSIRHFVKASVEALDIIRLTGNKHFLK